MKLKVYKGDLSQLRSCIKISGSMSDLLILTKRLSDKDISIDYDSDANVLVQFKDWIREGLTPRWLGNDFQVVEHIEPLNLDILLSKKDYEASYGVMAVSNHYRGDKSVYVGYRSGMLVWRINIPIEDDAKNLEDNILSVLCRRGLLDVETYKQFSKSREMKYYEA